MAPNGPQRATRLGARLATGRAARTYAFAADFSAALLRALRGRTTHPEEGRHPRS